VITVFTGIVEELGKVEGLKLGKICIKAHKVLEDTKLGDSIAVNGVCLTVTSMSEDNFTADVMPETLRRSSLGDLSKGSPVNLERALTLATRLGGHLVSGHIDGVGTIKEIKKEGNAIIVEIKAMENLLKYMIVKGSVAVDGISLTIVDVNYNSFSVSLIPHTREVTCLKHKRVGDKINIETDIIAKYVEKLFPENKDNKSEKSNLSKDFLQQYGF